MLLLGIDLGTQGVRAVVVDPAGALVCEAACDFPPAALAAVQPGWFEQDPAAWRRALETALAEAVARLGRAGHAADEIAALSVTSTSGTLCLVDEAGATVGPAMMYSDQRAVAEAREVQAAGREWSERVGPQFSASFALSRLRWLQVHDPARLARARWYLSPTDLVVGWLSGEWGVSDWTNMLKSGYDVVTLAWPDFIERDLGLPLERFPRVQAPGSAIGRVSAAAAQRTGLSTVTRVIAGATDGTASQFASGAARPGDWNSTLGTTLVLKGVTEALLRDPQGRLYCHRHPEGYWLPGGASSTGADCLAQRFAAERLDALNAAALGCCPTDVLIYPLMRVGERFPFVAPQATGFVLGECPDEATSFAAHLEGIAYVERLAYDTVLALGGEVGDALYVAGGGARSSAGLQVRADVLGRCLRVPEVPSGAMGAAILAARGTLYSSLAEATAQMVRYARTVEPRPTLRSAYTERYERFVAACRSRGYLE